MWERWDICTGLHIRSRLSRHRAEVACLRVCVSAVSKVQDSARAMAPRVQATPSSLPGYEPFPHFSQGMGHTHPHFSQGMGLLPSLPGHGPSTTISPRVQAIHQLSQDTGHLLFLPGYETLHHLSQVTGHSPPVPGYGPPTTSSRVWVTPHLSQGMGQPRLFQGMGQPPTPVCSRFWGIPSSPPGYSPPHHLSKGTVYPPSSPMIWATSSFPCLSQGTGHPIICPKIQANASSRWGTYFLHRLSQG